VNCPPIFDADVALPHGSPSATLPTSSLRSSRTTWLRYVLDVASMVLFITLSFFFTLWPLFFFSPCYALLPVVSCCLADALDLLLSSSNPDNTMSCLVSLAAIGLFFPGSCAFPLELAVLWNSCILSLFPADSAAFNFFCVLLPPDLLLTFILLSFASDFLFSPLSFNSFVSLPSPLELVCFHPSPQNPAQFRLFSRPFLLIKAFLISPWFPFPHDLSSRCPFCRFSFDFAFLSFFALGPVVRCGRADMRPGLLRQVAFLSHHPLFLFCFVIGRRPPDSVPFFFSPVV